MADLDPRTLAAKTTGSQHPRRIMKKTPLTIEEHYALGEELHRIYCRLQQLSIETGRIAVRPWLRGADEQPPAEFVDIVCFGGLAEHAAATVKKGDRIVVTGRLEDDVWTGRDGTERSGSKLLVDALGLDLRFRSTTTKATESSVLGTFGLPATTELQSGAPF